MAVGSGLAVLAALCFGLTTPIVARAGRDIGPFTTAMLLYLGACGSMLVLARFTPASAPPLRRSHLGRFALVAFFGAGIAPTLFAWGLQHVGAATGSLLLNIEAVFTVLFAWALYGEPVGRRVVVALALMALGGVALTLDAAGTAEWSGLGAIAVVGATAAWALDNTLTRPLAELDPLRVVAIKGALGAALTGSVSLLAGEPVPELQASLILLGCGATGYGLSLRFYLLAQRRIGAGRTGSIFAVAPFVGAALAWALGDQSMGWWTVGSAVLFGGGVYLHLSERHRHPHSHAVEEHNHTHRHDDGHHGHLHGPAFEGEHSHPHRHDALEHDHEHAPDVHHDHRHA